MIVIVLFVNQLSDHFQRILKGVHICIAHRLVLIHRNWLTARSCTLYEISARFTIFDLSTRIRPEAERERATHRCYRRMQHGAKLLSEPVFLQRSFLLFSELSFPRQEFSRHGRLIPWQLKLCSRWTCSKISSRTQHKYFDRHWVHLTWFAAQNNDKNVEIFLKFSNTCGLGEFRNGKPCTTHYFPFRLRLRFTS